MNLIDRKVTKILGKPYLEYEKWWLEVECIDEGGPGTTTLMFNSEEEALNISVGYIFQS